MTKKEYNIYIDESGDEGIKKGSKYFILTAIIIEKDKDLKISKCVDEIKKELEMNVKTQLHWMKIRGFPNKLMIVDTVSKQNIVIANVIIDTYQIDKLESKNVYFRFIGFLFERICWFARDNRGVVNIFISSRSNLSVEKLNKYLEEGNGSKFDILLDKIQFIQVIPNERKRLLQLADCCCSALFQSLKFNDAKHFEYMLRLKNNIYSRKNNIESYGLKFFPDGKNSIEYINLLNYLDK